MTEASMPAEPDPEDVEAILAGAEDLLHADTVMTLAAHDQTLPRDSVAGLLGIVRQSLETQRRAALILRRQPAMAARVADMLDAHADTLGEVVLSE